MEATPKICTVPPAGWKCSRPAGHDGPCAASPVSANPTAASRPQDINLEEFRETLAYCMDDDTLNIHDAAHLLGNLGTCGMSVLPTEYVTGLEERAKVAEGKLEHIRAMATRSVPQLINLAAIDRILGEEVPRG
jgi:hypothetical protein